MPTHVALVTPERVLHEGEADFVVLRTEGGDIMFLPNHADYVGAVDICTVRIASPTEAGGASAGSHDAGGGEGGEVRAAVHGGFVHVADNTVTVLASVAELAPEIHVPRAQRALEAAEAQLASGEDAGHGQTAAAPAATPATGEHGEPVEAQGVEDSPTMMALLHPDAPEVRVRRARARLEAAGALEGTAGVGSAAH